MIHSPQYVPYCASLAYYRGGAADIRQYCNRALIGRGVLLYGSRRRRLALTEEAGVLAAGAPRRRPTSALRASPSTGTGLVCISARWRPSMAARLSSPITSLRFPASSPTRLNRSSASTRPSTRGDSPRPPPRRSRPVAGSLGGGGGRGEKAPGAVRPRALDARRAIPLEISKQYSSLWKRFKNVVGISF